MSAYLQLGHESWSLLDEPDLGTYGGFVLSPVNDDPDYVSERLSRLKERRGDFEAILDPQLYNPRSEKQKLNSWPYFPSDFATAVREDIAWWGGVARSIVDEAERLGIDSVCSPAFTPKLYTADYYRHIVSICDAALPHAKDRSIDVLLTCIVNLRDLVQPSKASEIASIVSSSGAQRVYLMFLDDTPQRQPLDESEALPTAVHLVRLLSSQMRVHVAFSGQDVVLWKAAGATDVSSGKWMNVRRFSPARWEEEESGGRQVPYWSEHGLVALLREQDVKRLDREGWFKDLTFVGNPASKRILEIIRSGTGTPWQKLSWLQFLRWVSNRDQLITNREHAEKYLERCDDRWGYVQELKILFADRFNDGAWVRTWLNAIREGNAR